MKKKDRELLKLRQKTLSVYDILTKVSQTSWRTKKAKDLYSLEDLENVEFLYVELVEILADLLKFMDDNEGKIRSVISDYLKYSEERKNEEEGEYEN